LSLDADGRAGGGILGGAGSGRDEVSIEEGIGGRGALVRDDEDCGKPLLVLLDCGGDHECDGSGTAGRTVEAATCPADRVGPLLVNAVSLTGSDGRPESHLLVCGGG